MDRLPLKFYWRSAAHMTVPLSPILEAADLFFKAGAEFSPCKHFPEY